MDQVVSKLNELLGRLDQMNSTEELSPTLSTPKPTTGTSPQAKPEHISGQQVSLPDRPPLAAPSRAATAIPVQKPLTLDRLSLGELFAGLRRLSIPAAITVFGILVAVLVTTARLVEWMDRRSMDALSDSIRTQQRVIEAEQHRGDSLAAVLNHRAPTKP